MTDTHKEVHTLSQSVLNRIAADHIAPKPRWRVLLGEYGIWALWVGSVLFGAVAVAVMLFVGGAAEFELYEVTHESVWDFLLDVVPYAWIVLFATMALVAHINFRHTKRGYRYPVWIVLGSSVVASFFLGIGLHFFGVGQAIEMQLAKNMPMAPTLVGMEMAMWQVPQDGRLLGRVAGIEHDLDEVRFLAVDATEWVVTTHELMPADIVRLNSGDEVRIAGVLDTERPGYFFGCAVFPWRFGDERIASRDTFDRNALEERAQYHLNKAVPPPAERLERARASLEEISERIREGEEVDEMHCPKMPWLQRFPLQHTEDDE